MRGGVEKAGEQTRLQVALELTQFQSNHMNVTTFTFPSTYLTVVVTFLMKMGWNRSDNSDIVKKLC